MVRHFKASDYAEVLALDIAEQRSYRGSQWESADEDERASLLMTSPRYQETYENSEFCFVALRANVVVGFLFALHLLPDVLSVDALGVALAVRRQGVARAVYEALVRWARERGIRRIHALITLDNEASIALHASAGFTLRDRKEAVVVL